MKGKWIFALALRVWDGAINFRDAFAFIEWRFSRKSSIFIDGLEFANADHIVWSLITETFLHKEYTPRGFGIGPNDTVIDIGAHRGVFSGFAAKRTKNQIIAVEPDLENFKALGRFIQENHLTNIRILNCAIGATNATTTIYRSESSRHSITGFDQATGRALQDQFEVNCISLDTLLLEYAYIDFVKIDCEGAEYAALEAASSTTLEKINKLAMEIHGIHNTAELNMLLQKLKRSFTTVNFTVKSKTIGIVHAKKA